MKQANVRFTYDDYLLLPDDKRYEIVEGELLVAPAPNMYHQDILRELATALTAYVRERDAGKIYFAPCDVVLSPETVVQPDLVFVCSDRLGILTSDNVQGPPDLAVEVLSESTRRRDTEIKRKLFAKYGVREYWIVDPEAQTVEVLIWSEAGYSPGAVYGIAERLSSAVLPGLGLRLSEIFQRR